jgi:hypothetical protein
LFSLVFPNDANCGATLFLGHTPFVVGSQVPPPFRRSNQRVFAFMRHDSRHCHFHARLDMQILGDV